MGTQPQALKRPFYERPAQVVAGGLIGKILSYGPLSGRIVEVEAYDESEPASRGFSGLRKGNATLFGPPGHLEVYLSYGVNYLANVVCEPVCVGSGVLLRALEPLTGIEVMRANRGDTNDPDSRLCSGPGRLCKAFGRVGPTTAGILLSGKSVSSMTIPHFCTPEARESEFPLVKISIGDSMSRTIRAYPYRVSQESAWGRLLDRDRKYQAVRNEAL